MSWIPITQELPPDDGSLIYEYDEVFQPLLNRASITLQHINWDISNLGFSRVKYWAYKDSVEDSEGNITKPRTEPRSESVSKDTADNVKDDNRTKSKALKSWTSQNEKWTIEWSGNSKGSLVDNKTGRIYTWRYENGLVEVIGVKVPKYIDKKIKELSK